MSRPPRLPRFDYRGCYSYFLTCCTRDRRQEFVRADTVSLILTQFRRTADAEGFAILAFCFMPDHLHLLVQGSSECADLRSFVKLSRQRAGSLFARTYGRRLWQDGYYERVLRADEDARSVARYILANPVRGRLVDNPADHPYLGSDQWSLADLLGSV